MALIKINNKKLNFKDNKKILKEIRNSVHPNCVFNKGNGNLFPNLLFILDNDGVIKANFKCKPIFQGYSEQMHGGFISAFMDAAMTNCLFSRGIIAVTVNLSIRFLKPVKIGDSAVVRAWIIKESKRICDLKSEVNQNGLVNARAEGKFMINERVIS